MPTTNYDTPFGDDLFEAKTAKEVTIHLLSAFIYKEMSTVFSLAHLRLFVIHLLIVANCHHRRG
jgi:hypothetical protein